MVMAGKSLQAMNGGAGVSVSKDKVEANSMVGCAKVGDAVHVAGSSHAVGYASVGPSGCWLQVRYARDVTWRMLSQTVQAITNKIPRVIF
jgi:hypothetical protein